MSDLISRSELLKEVEKYKFGVISNDAEREYIKKTILDFIICQPTAYSVDKVVEELLALNKNYNDGINLYEEVAEIPTEEAIEIVKQEAEKFGTDINVVSNGWIPCSERLPEEYEDVEVTIEEIADYVGGKRYYNVRSWLQDGQWVIKKNPYKPTVIAWKYPTEPYQQKGEQ